MSYDKDYHDALSGGMPDNPLSLGAYDGAKARIDAGLPSNPYVPSVTDISSDSSSGSKGVYVPESEGTGIIIAVGAVFVAIGMSFASSFYNSTMNYINNANYTIKDQQSIGKYHEIVGRRYNDLRHEMIEKPLIEYGFQCAWRECTGRGYRITFLHTSPAYQPEMTHELSIISTQYPERQLNIKLRVSFFHTPNYDTRGYNINERTCFSVHRMFNTRALPRNRMNAGYLKDDLLVEEFRGLTEILARSVTTRTSTEPCGDYRFDGILNIPTNGIRSVAVRPAMDNGRPVTSNDWMFPYSLVFGK